MPLHYLAGLCLLFVMSSSSAASTEATEVQNLPSAANPPYPPLNHIGLKRFAAAMDLRGQVTQATDTFWLPGSAIVSDHNPGKTKQVDSLVSRLRAKLDGVYLASALFSVDKRLAQMLVPRIAQAEATARTRMQDIFRRTRTVDSPEQKRLALEWQKKLLAARPSVDSRLDDLAKQAGTPAGSAWLAGLAEGNYRCLAAYHVKASNHAFADKIKAEHCSKAWASSHDRLIATWDGRQFAELSSALYASAIGAMAMSFDAGLTLDRFLPRGEVEAAGLIYPDKPIDSEALAQRYQMMVRK